MTSVRDFRRNERHVDDGNTSLKTPTFTEDEDKKMKMEEQQVSIEDTARLKKIESEDEDATKHYFSSTLVCVKLLIMLFFYL